MTNRHNFLGGNAIDPKPVSGSMTVAELVDSAFSLIENGFVDWIVSTGANAYDDTHFGSG